jgi:hypothetical protein
MIGLRTARPGTRLATALRCFLGLQVATLAFPLATPKERPQASLQVDGMCELNRASHYNLSDFGFSAFRR